MDRRKPSLSYLPEKEGDEAEAAAAGLDDVALSSPRIVGQDWEQNGGSVIDLEAEKKRYLNQKQKRALSHKRIRDLDNSLDRDRSRSSSSGEAEAVVSGGAGNDNNQLFPQDEEEKRPEIAEGNAEGDAQGRVEATSPDAACQACAATPPDQAAATKMNRDELGDEEEGRNEEEGQEEWEKAADEPEAEPPTSAPSSSSSPTNEAAQTDEQPVEGKPAAEEDQTGGGEKGQGKGGGRLLSQLKNLMGSLSSKVRDGAVAAGGMNGGEGDDGDDNDEREDVWDELRVRTLRNTLVNKHMSHLDLNSKQIELVNVNVESWEDVFQEDELDEDEVARSPFSRWEIQDDTLLPMLLAIRTSANATHKQRSMREAETSLGEFKACQSCSLAVGGLGTKITMKDYAPQVFERLRELASVSFEDYIKAWSDSRISKEEDQEDLLAYSKDRRFLLRRVSRDQAKVLASVLPAYYLYIKGNPSSTIERFFGLHQIGAKGKKIYFVVVGNVFGVRTARQLKESFSVREPQTEERLSRAVKPRGRAGTENSLLPVPTGSSSPPKPGAGGRIKASTSSSALASSTFGGSSSGRASLSRSDGSSGGSSAPLAHLSDSSIPVVLVVSGLSSDPPSQVSSPYGTPLGSPAPSPPPSPLASAHPIIIPRKASKSPSQSPSNSPPSSPSVGPRKRSRTGLLGWRSLRSADTQQSKGEKSNAEDFASSSGDASLLPEPLVSLSRSQRAALLKQLDDDTKWLAQTGLANYNLTVGVASASDSEDSTAAAVVPGALSDSSTNSLPSMVCFVELPSREARKLGKPIHQPLLPDHAPSSVLKPRYRAHTFNDAPKSSPGGRASAPQQPQPGGSASDAAAPDGATMTNTTCRLLSPYHAGILSTARRLQADADADADAADCPRLGRGEEENEVEDDDGGFFLHLRQGARKMSSTPHRPEKVKETVPEEEGGEVGQRPEGEPSEADKEEDKEEKKEEATVVRLHFGITDILHKPAPRNSIRKVMGGGGGGLSAAQYAQSLCEAIAGRINVDGGGDDK